MSTSSKIFHSKKKYNKARVM